MKRISLHFAALLIFCFISTGTSQAAYTLENNVSLDNLAAGFRQVVRHVVNVPNGTSRLTIAITGGNGDADLYVKYGSIPTNSSFHCRPYSAGNRERCSTVRPRPGKYYIMVRAYRAFSGVSLTASYTEPVIRQPIITTPTPTPPAPQPPTPAATTPTQAPSCINDVQQQLLDAHNSARAQAKSCGGVFFAAAPPLQWNCSLAQAASAHSSDMANINFFSHTGSSGSSAGDRISATGYTWRAWAENIAAGQPTVGSVMQGWLNSPGHCRNIMSTAVTELGAAVESSPGAYYSRYWTAVFSRPQ